MAVAEPPNPKNIKTLNATTIVPPDIHQKYADNNQIDIGFDKTAFTFLSITKVHEIVTDILQPMMCRVKDESDKTTNVKDQLEEIFKYQKGLNSELKSLKRNLKKIDELEINFMKLEQEVRQNFMQSENMIRKQDTSIEALKYDIEKLRRQGEIDELRINKAHEYVENLQFEFSQYQVHSLDQTQMLHNDVMSRCIIIEQKFKEVEIKC